LTGSGARRNDFDERAEDLAAERNDLVDSEAAKSERGVAKRRVAGC